MKTGKKSMNEEDKTSNDNSVIDLLKEFSGDDVIKSLKSSAKGLNTILGVVNQINK
jgi:hypothetical protein